MAGLSDAEIGLAPPKQMLSDADIGLAPPEAQQAAPQIASAALSVNPDMNSDTVLTADLVTPDAQLPNIAGRLNAATQGLGQGITGNFGDELFAAIATPFRAAGRAVTGADKGKGFLDRLGTAYNLEVESLRNLNRQAEEEYPGAFLTGEVAGGIAAGGTAAKSGLTLLKSAKPTATSLASRGAAEGTVYGGIYGAGAGEGTEDTLRMAGEGATVGALTGGGVGVFAARSAKKAADKAIQTVEALRATKDAAYKAAEQGGAIIPAKKMQGFAERLQKIMTNQGVNLGQHPKSSGALDSFLKNAGGDISLEHVDLLRRNFLDAAMSGDPSEGRMAGIMLNRLDDFVDQIPGGALWREARKAHKIYRKSATVERLIERAKLRAEQYSNSGMDNALQTEFRQFVRNDKLMKGFTKKEKIALRAVANNGVTATMFRKLGKLAPSSGVIANMIHLMTASVNLPLAVGIMAAGEGGKQAARIMRQSSARKASQLVRGGGEAAAKRLTDQQQALMESFLIVGAQQGAT